MQKSFIFSNAIMYSNTLPHKRLVPIESEDDEIGVLRGVGEVRCGGVVGVVGLLACYHKINTILLKYKNKNEIVRRIFHLLILTFSVPLYNNLLLVKYELFHKASKYKLIQL